MKTYWGVEVLAVPSQQTEVSGQFHTHAALPRGNSSRYPLDRRLCGPQSRSERCGVEKDLLPLPGTEPRPSGPHTVAITAISHSKAVRAIYFKGLWIAITHVSTISF
jgi:hypothetical protein